MFGSIALGFQHDSSESDNEESTRLNRRNLRDATNIFEIPEERFLAYFHVNKEVFFKLLGEMEPRMKEAYRCTHIPATNKLATLLTFIGTGGYQASIGNEFVSLMSKSQVSKVISECLDIFENHLCPKWITSNRNTESESKTKEQFYNTAGIPGVIGCVDGTHVRIVAPGDSIKQTYYNRKGFYSIKVLAICDHDMTITFVDATNPGSISDAVIWDYNCLANDKFKSKFLSEDINSWFLGDSGFKLQPYMMTPYRNPTDDWQKKFNECHRKTHAIIERCLAVLKNRFRCIVSDKGLHYRPYKATQIVNTCCAMHNICIFYKNNWLPSHDATEFEEETVELPVEEKATSAYCVRDEIARNLS